MANLTTLRLALPLIVSYNHANHYETSLISSTQIPLINSMYANHINPCNIIPCNRVGPIFSTTWSPRVSSSSSSNPSSALLCFGARRRSSQDDSERLSVELTVSSEENEKILSSTEPYLADNFSAILTYEDLCKHLEPTIFKEEIQPHTYLADVMSQIRYTATPEQLLEEVDYCFLDVSGLPVVDEKSKCIGVVSKRDRVKASKGLQSTVREVMSSPAITMSAEKTVNDAAIVMLKNKIHRIPIVNEVNQVIGMVTRTDIFKALEGQH